MNEPRTLTEAIDRVRTLLLPLPWSDQVFGRAHVQQQLPRAYVSDGEYVDCRPNDEVRSVVFFYTTAAEKNDFDRSKHNPRHAIRARRDVVLIGWVNLESLNEYASPDGFPELIKKDLKTALKNEPCVVRIGDYQDGVLRDVFKPFNVTALNKKYDQWPFACFRLDLTLMTIEHDKP